LFSPFDFGVKSDLICFHEIHFLKQKNIKYFSTNFFHFLFSSYPKLSWVYPESTPTLYFTEITCCWHVSARIRLRYAGATGDKVTD